MEEAKTPQQEPATSKSAPTSEYIPPSLTYRQQLQMAMQLSKGTPQEKVEPVALFPRFADLAKKEKHTNGSAPETPLQGNIQTDRTGLIHWGQDSFETPEQENNPLLANSLVRNHLPVRKRFTPTWSEDDGIQCGQEVPSVTNKVSKAKIGKTTESAMPDSLLCAFCNLDCDEKTAGPLLQHSEGKGKANCCYVHEEWALWAPNAYYNAKEKLVGVVAEVARSRRLRCTECNKYVLKPCLSLSASIL